VRVLRGAGKSIYDFTECLDCARRKICRNDDKLTGSVSRMTLEALPQFLVHRRVAVREAARSRLEELCSGQNESQKIFM